MEAARAAHGDGVALVSKAARGLEELVGRVRFLRGELEPLQQRERALAKAVSDAVADVQALFPSVLAGLAKPAEVRLVEAVDGKAGKVLAEIEPKQSATVSVAQQGSTRALMVEERGGPDGPRVRMYAMEGNETPQQAIARIAEGKAQPITEPISGALADHVQQQPDPLGRPQAPLESPLVMTIEDNVVEAPALVPAPTEFKIDEAVFGKP